MRGWVGGRDTRIAALLAGILMLSTFLMVSPVQGTSAGVNWVENFDYATVLEMKGAGWTLAQESQTFLAAGYMTISGVGKDSSAICANVPSGVVDWNASVRGRWTDGAGGSIQVIVLSGIRSYTWWIDGYYNEFVLSVDGTKVLQFGNTPMVLDQWNVMSMRKTGNNISLFYNDQFMNAYTDNVQFGPVSGIGMGAPWQGEAEYDYITLEAAPGLEWQKTSGGTQSDAFYSAAPALGGGFVALGVTRSTGAGGYDSYLVRADDAGNILWERTYGTAQSEWTYTVCATSDGGFAIVGAATGAGFDIWLVRVDPNGIELWNKSYGGANGDAGFGVTQTSDGGFALTGYMGVNGNTDVFLIKTDAQGNLEWQKTYGGTAADWGKALIQTADGGYAISGWTQSFGDTHAYLVRTGPDGTMIWSHDYGGKDTLGYGIIETSNGFVLAGHTNSFGYGGNDIYAVRVDQSGGIIWERSYGGSGEDIGGAIIAKGDEFVFGGHSASFDALDRIYWVNTDGDGNVICAGIYGPTGVTVSGTIPYMTADGRFVAVGLTNVYGSGSDDGYLAIIGPGSVIPPPPVVGSPVNIMTAAAVPAAVVVGAGLGGLGVLAAGGNQLATAGGGPSNRISTAWGRTRKILRIDVLYDFVYGYTKGMASRHLFKQVAKIELEKGVAKERHPFFAGFSQLEFVVIVVTSVLLGLAYMVASKIDMLQVGMVLMYVLVCGLALIIHDLTHKYAAWRIGAVTEYQFWGLGTLLMIITTAVFGIVYALPARTTINDVDKLSVRDKAIIYAAGPMVSFLLFIPFLVLLLIGGTYATIGALGCSANLLAAVYGLMPFEPMDGKKVVKYKKYLWALMFFPLLALYIVLAIYVF